MELTLIQKICVYALPVLFAITLHEAAHAYAARYFGDPTAYLMGRTSLNPLKHIDPIGTVVLPLLSIIIGGFLFGWAKPVPVNFAGLRHPKRDMRWVALAGPAANLVMAIGWTLLLKLALTTSTALSEPLIHMAKAGISINVVLMALNLLPFPPLDGGRVLISLLPPRLAYPLARIEPYGLFILLALLLTQTLNIVLAPLMDVTFALLQTLL
jgi:Zn-dependent protease